MRKVSYINIILRVNQVSYIITWGLFITIIYGFLAEIYLGFLQIISSLLLLLFWKHLSPELKKGTYYYWIAVTIYFISFYLMTEFDLFSNSYGLGIIGILFIPMLIGLYLLLHLSSIKKSLIS